MQRTAIFVAALAAQCFKGAAHRKLWLTKQKNIETNSRYKCWQYSIFHSPKKYNEEKYNQAVLRLYLMPCNRN